jgi:hypothetical protein
VRTVRDVEGAVVRLSAERWRHVTKQHPETRTEIERVLGTVAQPDYVLDGDGGTLMAVRRYEQTPVGRKHCVVVYRRIGIADGFIVTAYFARSPSRRRRVIWPA